MMTFYVGKDYRIYEKKWKDVSLYFSQEMELKGLDTRSKAAVFRYLIDKLWDELNKNNNKEEA